MQAAEELIQAAPTTASSYQFYAQVCVKTNRLEEAFSSMRKAIRLDPKNINFLLELAKMLSVHQRESEAIELHFLAMDKTDELEDLLELVNRLTDLYRNLGSSLRLQDRLEAERKLPGLNRSRTICLAQYWQNNNDPKKARKELESLLLPESRDTLLINQLAKLCHEAGDLSSAVSYQRRLVAVTPGPETEIPLANLLFEIGQADEAREIIVAQIMSDTDSVRQLSSIDSLLLRKDWETADKVLTELLNRQPNDWEMLYRLGVAKLRPSSRNYRAKKEFETPEAFRQLLTLDLPLESLGREALKDSKSSGTRRSMPKTDDDDRICRWCELSGIQMAILQLHLEAVQIALPSRQVTRSNPTNLQRPNSSSASSTLVRPQTSVPLFHPNTFAESRLASLALLYELNPAACDRLVTDLEMTPRSRSPLIDLYDRIYHAFVRNDIEAIIFAAKQAAEAGGDFEKRLFLQSLQLKYSKLENNHGYPGVIPIQRANSVTISKIAPSESTAVMTQESLRQAIAYFLEISPERRYSSNTGGAQHLSMNQGMPIQISSQGVFSGYASTWNRPTALIAPLPLPSFLLDQANQVGDVAIIKLIEQDVLDYSPSPGLVMSTIAQRVKRGEADNLDAMCQRWGRACETIVQSQVNNIAAPNLLQIAVAVQNNVQAVARGTDQLGCQPLSSLAVHLQNQNRTDLLNRLLQQTIPFLFEISQKLSAGQPQANRLSNLTATRIQQSPRGQQVQLNSVLLRLDMMTSALIANRLMTDAKQSNLQITFKQLLDSASDDDLKACWASNLANLQILNQQYASATESLTIATELRSSDIGFQLMLSYALAQDKRLEESLSVLKKIRTDVPSLAAFRNLMMIDTNIQLKDKKAAIEMIQSLKNQSLSAADLLKLHDQMLNMNLKDEAQELSKKLPRTRTTTTLSSSSVSTTLSLQAQAQNLKALSSKQREERTSVMKRTITIGTCMLDLHEVNNELIRAISQHGILARDSNSRTSNATNRRIVLFLLAQVNELATMIANLEADLKKNSGQLDKWMLLIEYKTCNGASPISDLREVLKREPNSKSVRFMLATYLERQNSEESIQIFESLLKDHPNWTCQKLLAIEPQAFSDQVNSSLWAKALLRVEPKFLKDSTHVINHCKKLLSNQETSELGMQLFDHLARSCTDDLSNLFVQFAATTSSTYKANPKLTDRFFAILLPSASEIELNKMTRSELLTDGLDPSVSQIPTGWLTPIEIGFARLNVEQTIAWKNLLKTHIKENPDWLLGPMLLLQTDLQLGLEQEAIEVADSLIRMKELRQVQDPATLRWFGSRVFQRRRDAVSGEIELLEHWLDRGGFNDRDIFARLLQVCENSSPNPEIRNVLARRSLAYSGIGWRQFEIVQVQQKLGYSLDAIRSLSRFTGDIHHSASIDLLREEAVDSLKQPAPNALIESQLFSENIEGTSQLIDLVAVFPTPSGLFSEQLFSPVADQFALAVSTDQGNSLRDRLNKILAQSEAQIAARILELLWLIHQQDISEEQLISKLDSLLTAISINSTGQVDTMALSLLAVKLHDSELYGSSPAIREQVQKIIQLVQEWMGKPSSVQTHLAMLASLAKLCVKDQIDKAESICEEMLNLLEATDQSGLPATTKNKIVPVLSMTQFKQTLAIGRFAGENGMTQVQLRALRLALVDRWPPVTPESSSEIRLLFRSLESQQMSVEIFTLLKQTVFLTSPIKQLHFHAEESDRTKGPVDNAAVPLVDFAIKLNQLTTLDEANQLQTGDRITQLSYRKNGAPKYPAAATNFMKCFGRKPLAKNWKAPQVVIEHKELRPDIYSIDLAFAVNERAMKTLSGLIAPFVEFLPVEVVGKRNSYSTKPKPISRPPKLYLVNPLVEVVLGKGAISHVMAYRLVNKYVFHPDDLEELPIFRAKEDICILVDESFVKMVTLKGLRGLQFEDELVWHSSNSRDSPRVSSQSSGKELPQISPPPVFSEQELSVSLISAAIWERLQSHWIWICKAAKQRGGDVVRKLKVARPLSDKQLSTLQDRIGEPLPKDFLHVLTNYSAHVEMQWDLANTDYCDQFPSGLQECCGCYTELWNTKSLPRLADEARKIRKSKLPYFAKTYEGRLPFIEVGNGDHIAFDMRRGATKCPVIYLCHDDSRINNIVLGRCFAEFLMNWSCVGCIGPDFEYFRPFYDSAKKRLNCLGRQAIRWRKLMATGHIG